MQPCATILEENMQLSESAEPDHGLIEAALEISRERRDTLQQLVIALEGNEYAEAKALARKLIGHETSHRTHPRIHRIASRPRSRGHSRPAGDEPSHGPDLRTPDRQEH